MKCKNNYVLPIDLNTVTHWHKESSPAHAGKLKHSIDFLAKEGTEIYAALDGDVVWIKDDSNEGGPDRKYEYSGNRIVLKHDNEEYTAYEHNRCKSARVKIGDKVKKGQVIAEVGSTGWSGGPHLHFEIFVDPAPDESEGYTVEDNFNLEKKGECTERCFL